MKSFIDALATKKNVFQFGFSHQGSAEDYLKKCLVNHPDVLSTICSLSYTKYSCGMQHSVFFNVSYQVDQSELSFLVRDDFELITAVTIILKSHKSCVKIIVDNTKHFVEKDTLFSHINQLQCLTGIDFEQHQRKCSQSLVRSFFNEEILVCELSYQYFDNSQQVNNLSCAVSEHYEKVKHYINTPLSAVNYLLKWFRNNIKYKDNNLTADHSAFGLIQNGTAVCQGIAVYAYLFLNYCGVKAYYVSGFGKGAGGWGPHAWNLVYIDNEWKHIDYTFELESRQQSIFRLLHEFKRDHQWDEKTYSTEQLRKITLIHNTLNESIITLLPNQKIFSINGCIAYIPRFSQIATVINNQVMIALLEVINLMGGSYSITASACTIYLKRKKYQIPINSLIISNGRIYFTADTLNLLCVSTTFEGNSISMQLR